MMWSVAAGGTSAASDKYSYSTTTEFGEYRIWPVSHRNDVEHHLGYRAFFLNTKGKLSGGLWQTLNPNGLVDLRTAQKLCREHHKFGRNGKYLPT